MAAPSYGQRLRIEVSGLSFSINFELIVDLMVFLVIYGFLLTVFKPSLMLSPTITTGGDMASHYYPSKFLAEELLPRGRVIGWLPGWYGGMPLFQFYFPIAFVAIALLSYVIPLQIAFKIITVSGIFLLPFCAYSFMRLMRFEFPIPVFAAAFTLPFLFQESHSMWGGNIPSTLAGEFSYGISLSLTLLFFGALYRGLQVRSRILHNSVLLAVVALTHVYTVLWAVASSVFLVFSLRLSETKDRLLYMAKSYPLAFMLTGFWIIPLLSRLKYTTSYDIPWSITEDVMPPILWPFVLLALFGAMTSFYRAERRGLFMSFSIATALLYFILAPRLGVVDIRFLPFVYLSLMMLAAYGLGRLTAPLKAKWTLPLIVVISTIFWVNSSQAIVTQLNPESHARGSGIALYLHFTDNATADLNLGSPGVHLNLHKILPELRSWTYRGYSPFWVKWNYEGFEKKSVWPQYKETNDYLRGGWADPRAQFEHNDQHNAAGTVRAFESIPLFSGRSILEGLYMQSIITSPFVFYIQSEISEQQSCPFWAVFPCTHFDLENGTEHLKMFNTRYIVARSDRLKKAMRENGQWRLAHEADPFEVWELTTSPDSYVTVPKNLPVLFETSNWKNISYQWFKRMDLIGTPIAFKKSVDYKDEQLFGCIFRKATVGDLDRLPQEAVDRSCQITSKVSAEEIDFTTDCIGAPHIISISDYPSWSVEGADRIYLVSPSFMLVYPTQKHVRIVYGKTAEDWFGLMLSVVAVSVIAYAILAGNQRLRGFFLL